MGIAVVAMLFAAARYSFRMYESALFRPLEDYSAIRLTHEMLALYVTQTRGEWPSDWADLESVFELVNDKSYCVPDLDWVRDRVTINFNVDVKALTPPNDERAKQFDAISLVDGTETEETRKANRWLSKTVIRWASPKFPTRSGT